MLELHALLEAQREAVLQHAAAGIEQQDGEHLVVDDAGQQVGNALQQLIDIQDRGELAADLGEQRQLARLPRDARVQPRVLDADGDARGKQRQQPLVLFGEGAGLIGFDVDHADDFVLGDQRNGQLGAHAGRGVDEVLFGGDVVDQHGFAALHGLPGDALADLDADALGDLRRMADLEADAQLLRLLVQQQDGEDLVVDEPLQHLGHALQQRVQVERGVDRVGHLKQIGVKTRRRLAVLWWQGMSFGSWFMIPADLFRKTGREVCNSSSLRQRYALTEGAQLRVRRPATRILACSRRCAMPLPEFKQLVDEAKSQISEIGPAESEAHAAGGRRFHPD